jgi:hypothetical protein
MKKISIKLIYKTVLVTCLISTFSCKKVFDIAPQDQVDVTNHYRDVYDANAAVIGIYGQFMTIADRYIVLNELRADLMSPTVNADQYLRQLNEHSETVDNPWADPRPFYKIILNCNDAMAHFDTMVKEAKMTASDYQQRYSDVGAIRSFIYLQLGIQYGSIPYVTDPIANVQDLSDASKFPKITFAQLIDNLVAFMGDGKRFLEPYTAAAAVTGATNTSLNTTVDGYPTNLMFINKRVLLGDLYLWKGNYTKASEQYRNVCDIGYRNDASVGNLYYDQYKVTDDSGFFTISYSVANDERTLVESNTIGWRSMFALPTQNTNANIEWIWTLPFDKNYVPVDPFINLFSNQGGSYQLTASQLAMDNWNSQVQTNGFPYDGRGRQSVRTVNGQPVIMKQLYYYVDPITFLPTNIFQKQGRWLIYRGATNLAHFAEAALNDPLTGADNVKLAYALTNVGVQTVYNGTWPNTTPAVPSDRTNLMQTKLSAPYDLDARNGETPYFRSQWYRERGSRTRANLPPLPTTLVTNNDKLGMENAIVDESGLELAFEGTRWSDLMRVAMRRQNPAFLADKVYQKLLRDGNPNAIAVRAKLMTPANWYMPFKL